MYATRPAAPGTVLEQGTWGIRRAARQLFAEPAQLSHNDAHNGRFREYTGDMLAAFGMSLGAFEGRGQSYGEMAEALIRQVVAPGEQVDVLVLAYAVPDIAPGRATATYLSYVCPGNPLAFAVTDQGSAAAFTGLRLVREYARTGGCPRGLLLVVEQADLPYDTASELPAAHAAVALLCGPDPVAEVGRIVNRPNSTPVLTATGKTIAGRAVEASVVDRLAPDGQPYTGVWWELAGVISGHEPGDFVVADFDPQLRYLSTAEIAVR